MLTFEKAISETRQLYTWLRDNLGKLKGSCPKPNVLNYINQCPCCQYVTELTGLNSIGNRHSINLCEQFCPLEWPKNKKNHRICFGPGGLWTNYKKLEDDYLHLVWVLKLFFIKEREDKTEVLNELIISINAIINLPAKKRNKMKESCWYKGIPQR
ncbi:hypothetical protein A2Z67_03790 [Candidatus Woesebacteria bacterium RBG_13_36_22]|uniref:Uncharacterized protein n=1 Tax=Candidatus Woesebacteria bacterium RBG_13_36_22 TaxID=1802478 RepID=A0A1F7X308_9BACT|nr:MAG: hypothetical protein A2Z67_03790 [Candidatus Woesebacteria bacterium RBG_13_36_22]